MFNSNNEKKRKGKATMKKEMIGKKKKEKEIKLQKNLRSLYTEKGDYLNLTNIYSTGPNSIFIQVKIIFI